MAIYNRVPRNLYTRGKSRGSNSNVSIKEEKILFVNNNGEEVLLDKSTPLVDLLKIGCKGIRFSKPGEPLEDGWWIAIGTIDK